MRVSKSRRNEVLRAVHRSAGADLSQMRCRESGWVQILRPMHRTAFSAGHKVSFSFADSAQRGRGGSNDARGRAEEVTLFADLKGSMDLMEDLDPEDARAIVDPAFRLMI